MAGKREDSLLAHCVARAIIADVGGEEAARERWGEDAAGVSASGRWERTRLTVKVTPKASRVAAFVVLWARAMKDEKRDGFTARLATQAQWRRVSGRGGTMMPPSLTLGAAGANRQEDHP